MIKLIKKIFWFFILLLVLAGGLLAFFTFTTTGLKTLIQVSSLYFHQPIKVHGLQGSLYNQPRIEKLDYQNPNVQVTLKKVHVRWDLSSLLHHELPIRISAESMQIKQNDTKYLVNNIYGNALLTLYKITIRSLTLNYLNTNVLGQLELGTHYPYAFNSTVTLTPLSKNSILTGKLNAGGDINQINWSGDFQRFGTVSLQGTLNQQKQLEQTIKWRDLNWPTDTTKEPLSKEGRITIAGTLPNLHIKMSSKVNRTPQEQWQVNGEVQGVLPWSWHFNFNAFQPYDASSKHEGIYTNFALNGALKNPSEGSVMLKIAPGQLQIPSESGMSSLAFQGGTITAQLTTQGIKGLGSLSLDEHKKLDINFALPHFNLQQGITDKQTVSSELSLNVNSFDFLAALVPELKNPKGSLTLSLSAKGPLKKPNIASTLTLNKASMEIPTLGLDLNTIDCSIASTKDRWEGTGTITSANKTLNIKAQGLLTAPWPIELTIEGTDFPVINTQEYQVSASPKLQIKYTKDIVYVMGSILVPQAQIKIQSFSNSISLSNDVVFKSKEKTYSNPLQTQIDVQVQTGDKVELSAKGLHAILEGTVNIKQSPQRAMSATGELNVVKGEYKAYGQNLVIEQGELFFTGGAVSNPGVNLRASKNINTSSTSSSNTNQVWDFSNNNLQSANLRGNITVGVEVTGRLTDPEIQLFSTPAILSQADILSMLVLGRPASQANKAGAQLLLAAISSMNLGSNGTKGTQLLEQLKQNLGIDFNVETSSNYNLLTNTVSDKTALVVSKSLSKRISLGYNVGLSQAEPNVVTLKYLLNKFFSIQINSSTTSSGIDVLYTSSKK